MEVQTEFTTYILYNVHTKEVMLILSCTPASDANYTCRACWLAFVCSMWSMLTRQGASWVVVLLPPRILGLKCNTVRSHDVISSSNGLLSICIHMKCYNEAAQSCVTGQTGCTNLDSLCGRGSCLEHSGWISAGRRKVGILTIHMYMYMCMTF